MVKLSSCRCRVIPMRRRQCERGAWVSAGSPSPSAVDPAAPHLLPCCPLLSLAGFACPGCGLTRAFHSLSHGNVLTALDSNALIPIWTFIFGYLFVSLVLTAIRGKGLSW